MTSRTTMLWLASTALLFAGCASQSARKPPDAPTDANSGEAAQLLEKKFQEAMLTYRRVERDGRTLYCRHEKVVGSTIPTTQCLTEGQLRLQVEYDQQMRERMRTGVHCSMGHRGGAGGCAGS